MKPDGTELLAILIKLLADQEGVEITYELSEGGCCQKAAKTN